MKQSLQFLPVFIFLRNTIFSETNTEGVPCRQPEGTEMLRTAPLSGALPSTVMLRVQT